VTVIRACLATLLGMMLGLGTPGLGALAQNGGSNTVLDTLFAKLQTATDPMAIQTLESAIWEQWIMVPDATQRGLMLRGIGEMQQRELKASVETFSKLIEIAPDLSEAWNKRATAYWLLGDFQASLADICETIKREPRHFGAYSGLGMIRAEMGEYPRAVAALELARKYNPHITGIDDEIDRLKAMGGDGPTDPLGCSQRTAGR
jgi:tetratricopeptide (TPR) repeat protein